MRKKNKELSNATYGLFSFDFDIYGDVGYCQLMSVSEGCYNYEAIYQNQMEDDGGFYYLLITLDHPMTNGLEIPYQGYKQYTFSKSVLDKFVAEYETYHKFIDKAIELNAEVYGEEYTHTAYRYMEPWATMKEAIIMAIEGQQIDNNNIKKYVL